MLIVLKITAYREVYQRLPKATYIVAHQPSTILKHFQQSGVLR